MNHPIKPLDGDNKTKLVPDSFSYISESYETKITFTLKRVIDITVIISLHYKETN